MHTLPVFLISFASNFRVGSLARACRACASVASPIVVPVPCASTLRHGPILHWVTTEWAQVCGTAKHTLRLSCIVDLTEANVRSIYTLVHEVGFSLALRKPCGRGSCFCKPAFSPCAFVGTWVGVKASGPESCPYTEPRSVRCEVLPLCFTIVLHTSP